MKHNAVLVEDVPDGWRLESITHQSEEAAEWYVATLHERSERGITISRKGGQWCDALANVIAAVHSHYGETLSSQPSVRMVLVPEVDTRAARRVVEPQDFEVRTVRLEAPSHLAPSPVVPSPGPGKYYVVSEDRFSYEVYAEEGPMTMAEANAELARRVERIGKSQGATNPMRDTVRILTEEEWKAYTSR